VANHVPFEVSADLSYDDVRRILEWSLEYLRAKGLSSSGRPRQPAAEVYVDQDEVAQEVLGRAAAAGVAYTDDQVVAVLDAQFGYFDEIGAIGPQAEGGEGPDRPAGE
jgi:hypothetical protein